MLSKIVLDEFIDLHREIKLNSYVIYIGIFIKDKSIIRGGYLILGM
jgi:hypothetical protein